MDDEAAEIELLEQNLHKTRQTSQRMISLLNTFDTRLAKLEKTILPLYDATQILNRRASNIEKTLAKIDEVASNREDIAAEEASILRGPNPNQLEVYTDALARLNASLAFGTSDRDSLDTARLVETGAKKLCQLYTKLVAEGSSGESSSRGGSFPSSLRTSLQPLVTFLRTLPVPATHPSHPAATAILGLLKDAQKGFADMRGSWNKKILEPLGKRFLERADDLDSVAAGREYGKWVEALFDVALDEHVLLSELAPLASSQQLQSAYTTLLSPLMLLFSDTTTSLVTLIKKSLHKHAFLALAANEALLSAQDRFYEVSTKRGGDKRDKDELREAITSLRSLGNRSFPEFLADIKLSANPAGGRVDDTGTGIDEVTLSTVKYLDRLPDVQGAAASALLALGDGNWKMGEGVAVSKGPKLGEGDEQIILEHFVFDIIQTLSQTLTALSKLKRPAFGSMYLLNNTCYIRQHVIVDPRNEATPTLLSRPTKDTLNSSFRMAKAGYFDANYSPLMQALNDNNPKDKEKGKDKVTRFYDLLDEVVERHKLGNRQILEEDEDERENLADEVVKLVVPSLQRFVGKFKEKESKNPQKYIKMTPEAVENTLRTIYR
ncbi:exocyst complex component, exo70 subunit [Flagelloscypha sp. PMI_526]|nr:exocyst complex component, exo70 subunit [Flagelloscypha sp. PMI_526]